MPHPLTPAQVGHTPAEIALYRIRVTIDAQLAGQVRAGALRVRRGVKADHGRAGRGGHVRRAGVRADHEVGGGDQREELLERRPADQVRRARLLRDDARILFFERRVAAREDDFRLQLIA